MAAVTLLDGSMGRELALVGAPFRQPEWSALALIESPEHVRAVHESYARAGVDLLTTNAYALVPFHIGAERFGSDGARLAALAGSLAREVADRFGVRVAGCLPPVLGSYMPEVFDAAEARPILEVLIESQAPYVDLWLAETQSSIAEAEAVRAVLDTAGDDHPLWVSFTLEDSLAGGIARLRSGEPVGEAARAAVGSGASAVLFNCSQPEVMESAVAEAVAAVDVPVGAYANAFVVAEGGANASIHDLRDDLTPDAYVEFVARWIAVGAEIVGGCCGIGPAHIAAIRSSNHAQVAGRAD